MGKLDTVFWDLDGTLADTEMLVHRKAFNLAFSEFELKWYWNTKDYAKLLNVGGGKKRIVSFSESLNFNLEKSVLDELYLRKQYYYNVLLNKCDLCLRPGVARLLSELSSKNIKQFIVTTSSKNSVEVFIKKFFKEASNPFNGFITGDDVEFHKPNPQAYLLALQLSKSSPTNSIVIEDSFIGLQSAKQAGIKCLMTLSPWLHEISAKMKIAELIVDHLGDPSQPFKVIHGYTSNSMVNYNCLYSLIKDQ